MHEVCTVDAFRACHWYRSRHHDLRWRPTRASMKSMESRHCHVRQFPFFPSIASNAVTKQLYHGPIQWKSSSQFQSSSVMCAVLFVSWSISVTFAAPSSEFPTASSLPTYAPKYTPEFARSVWAQRQYWKLRAATRTNLAPRTTRWCLNPMGLFCWHGNSTTVRRPYTR